jgi:Zn-dependent M32 family carboxypeptidase
MMKDKDRDLSSVILPYSAAEEAGAAGTAATDTGETSTADALDSLLNQYGQEAETGEVESETETGEQTQPQTETKTPTQEDKTNYAFGQMRQQINNLTGILGKVAKANNIEYNNLDDLVKKMSDDAIEKMAKSQNVPVELLQKLEQLEQNQSQWQRQTREQAAYAGFQTLTDKYSLTEDDLKAFAVELDADGKNPFVQDINLENEYKVKHFDDILKKQVDKAVKEVLEKSGAADQHSTTPAKQQGTGAGAGTDNKITTVDGLTQFLKDFPS